MTVKAPYVPADDDAGDEPVKTSTSPNVEEQNARDAMVAAAEAAMREGADDSDDDPLEKPKAKPVEEETEEEPEEKKPSVEQKKVSPKKDEQPKGAPLSELAKVLHKREQKRESEEQYNAKMAEADAVLSRAKGMYAQLQEELQEARQAKQTALQQLEAIKRKPMSAMKELGWNPEEFVDNALQEKDPNYQRFVQLQGALSERDQRIDKLTSLVEQLVHKAKQYDEQTAQHQQQAEVQEFFASIPKDSPVWEDYDDEDDILYFARKVRTQYKERTGKVASPKELGEYLHFRALQKRSASAEPAGHKPKQAGQTKAKVSRALGSSDASERRSNGKSINDMSRDEERDYLIAVAEAALHGD